MREHNEDNSFDVADVDFGAKRNKMQLMRIMMGMRMGLLDMVGLMGWRVQKS